MTSDLQRLVAEHERQRAVDAGTADPTLLTDALTAIESLSAGERLETGNVRAAVNLLFRLGKRAETVDLLAEYLAQDLDTDDEAWARWERTDNLALMRRFDGRDDRILAFDSRLGQWRHVPDIPTFQALGFYWCDVTAADAAFFERIIIGPAHPATDRPARSDYPNCSTG